MAGFKALVLMGKVKQALGEEAGDRSSTVQPISMPRSWLLC
jgi:hypothetical protein